MLKIAMPQDSLIIEKKRKIEKMMKKKKIKKKKIGQCQNKIILLNYLI